MAEKKERKPVSEETKAKRAAALAKAREAKKAKAEADAKEAEEIKAEVIEKVTETVVDNTAELEALKAQIAMLQQQLANTQTPQVVTVASNKEKVWLLWQAEVCDENEILLGEGGMYGRITGKYGTAVVPKDELSRIMTPMVRYFLDKRWLIVVNGLTDEERELLGVKYEEGEILDKNAFAKMVELGDKMLEIYPHLCEGHKAMVGKRYYEAWQRRDTHVTREIVSALSRISDSNVFRKIIEEMNEEDAQ